ncbi:MAG: LamG domain-containing protein [Verrucomicrobia bacterium]|nr:LamG domain-containing protein [Verrucomicrobiota bacterium]
MQRNVGLGLTAVVIGVLGAAFPSRAETVIDSFSQNGVIRWQVSSSPETCDVEWASSPAGPWRRSWDGLKDLVVTGSSSEVSVPMFYRIVRTVPWQSQDLVLWMPLNSEIDDHSTCSNIPTATGWIDFGDDRAGSSARALRLDLGEYLTAPATPCLSSSNVTVSLWASFKTFTNYPCMIELGPHNTSWQLFIDQVGTSSTAGWFYVRGGAASPAIPVREVLQTNRWYHMAATFAGNTAILYLDGEPRATGTVANVGTVNDTLHIGRNAKIHSTSDYYFSGSLDDIRVYRRVLSADQVYQLYLLAP